LEEHVEGNNNNLTLLKLDLIILSKKVVTTPCSKIFEIASKMTCFIVGRVPTIFTWHYKALRNLHNISWCHGKEQSIDKINPSLV